MAARASVYRVIEVIGVSSKSWEDAAAAAQLQPAAMVPIKFY